jgi:hypothetical protein
VRRRPDPLSGAEERRDLNQRQRLAFVAAAEDRSRSTIGRCLTDEELRRVLLRYPGDVLRT